MTYSGKIFQIMLTCEEMSPRNVTPALALGEQMIAYMVQAILESVGR